MNFDRSGLKKIERGELILVKILPLRRARSSPSIAGVRGRLSSTKKGSLSEG